MEDVLRPIYQERASNSGTLGVLLVEKNKPDSPLTDGFSAIIIVITEELKGGWLVKHYEFNNETAALHVIEEKKIKEWFTQGGHPQLLNWVLNGKVLFERNEYISKFREMLNDFPINIRRKRMGIEFSRLIRSYVRGKDFYGSKQYLDAYNQMIEALHHLGRHCVIEHGFHPEVTVWNQVKQIEPEIYKLYQELVESNEPLEKRIELILIASGFSITARTKSGSQHIIEVMKSGDDLWSFADLKNHSELKEYSLNLSVFIEYLIDKNIVEVVEEKTKSKGIFHRKYRLK